MNGACGTQRDVANVNRTLAGKAKMKGIFRIYKSTRNDNISLVNAVVNIRVPKNAGNFLSS